MVSWPPSGMASRAFTARLSSAISSWLASVSAGGVELLRLEQRLAGLVEFALGLAALGDVAGDLGEADDVAGVVADRVDHHVGPEARAILAHPPAFLFEAALGGGGAQRLGGLA